ncbi:hypothetical protein ANTQUA_LOCUS10550 [Anthophora quadrimaculata]
MLSKQRWWNSGSRTLLHECTCQKHISLQPRIWKGRIAAIQFLAQLQQQTPVVRYLMNYTMLSKQRWVNAGSGTLLYESTCQKHISLQQRFFKGRIAAIQFLPLLQQEITVVRYFVNYTMISMQRCWNSGSRTLLYENTCEKHISLQPRFWKGRIAAIQFLAQLQQETPVVRYFVNYTMLSMQRWWNAGSGMLLYESTCQKHISLHQRFWRGRIAAILFSALLQEKTPVVRYFVNYTMITLLQQQAPEVRYLVNYTMTSKQRWWNAGSVTMLYESTCQNHISLQPRFWKGRIAAIQFLAQLQQETPVVRYIVNYTTLSKQRLWNVGTRTNLIECTCQKHISLQQRFWKGRIAAILFSALLQKKTPVVRYFVYHTMLSKQRWVNAGSGTLLYESTCQKHISLQQRFWKGRIAAIQFLALLQQETPVVRYFVNYTTLSKQRLWNVGTRTNLSENTCQKHISLQQWFRKGRIAAVQFLALLQEEITVVLLFHEVYHVM